jgi:hypothetical protein
MDREIREINFSELVAICVIVIVICGVGTVFFLSKVVKSDALAENEHGVIRQLSASIKGSIYGTGEIMSVFGVCVDLYDIPVINSTAFLSAWYPNGTQFIFYDNMSKLREGYFIWMGIMSVEQGTYLTELDCFATLDGVNQSAKAFGEWQNPFWVNYLENMTASLSVSVANISNQIVFLNQTVVSNFNATDNMILQTQVIANSSVDRNNSLLAYLLYVLMNWTQQGAPCGNLTIDEVEVGDIRYYHDWMIKVKAYNFGNLISSPGAACVINTTLTNPAVYMDVEGDHFSYTEHITTVPGSDFSWKVNCFCLT